MKIAVVGAAGRMGQMLVRRIAATEGMSLGGASESPNSNAIGRDAGEVAGLEACGVKIGKDSAAAAGRQVKLEDVWRKARDGHTGARPSGEIGFATLRGGEEVGVHTVMFAAAGERLELSHRAFSRETYAAGAVHAAQWLAGKKPGLY